MKEAVDNVLVVLNLPPALEEEMVDWLLERSNRGGFTASHVFGHSSQAVELSAAEQVRGSRKRVQFQVKIERSGVDDFIAALGAGFMGADVRYEIIPVISAGHLGSS